MTIPQLDIIVVNWNSGALLGDCLRSIASARPVGVGLRRIIIIDNASTDGSADRLPIDDLPVEVIRNPHNKGFSAACNQGFLDQSADFLLFLNPDVRIFAHSLDLPAAFLSDARNAHVGIVGIQLVDTDGTVQRTCVRFPGPFRLIGIALGLDRLLPGIVQGHFMTDWDHRDSREVDQVMGAFFLVRRSLFEDIGGFDERFFVYYEELDFSLRARHRGFSSWYLAEAQAYHRGEGTTNQVKGARLFYSLRSRVLYAYKHFGWVSATGVALVAGTLEPWIRIAHTVLKGSGHEVPDILQGYIRFWKILPSLIMRGTRADT